VKENPTAIKCGRKYTKPKPACEVQQYENNQSSSLNLKANLFPAQSLAVDMSKFR
jgi:hypothetical protein